MKRIVVRVLVFGVLALFLGACGGRGATAAPLSHFFMTSMTSKSPTAVDTVCAATVASPTGTTFFVIGMISVPAPAFSSSSDDDGQDEDEVCDRSS